LDFFIAGVDFSIDSSNIIFTICEYIKNKYSILLKILQRIKKAYNIKTDADLARFLGLKPNTLAMQKKRNAVDLDRIFKKCEDLNKNWLVDGIGPMRLKLHEEVEEIDGFFLLPLYKKVKVTDENGIQPEGDSYDRIAFRKEFIHGEVHTDAEHLFALKITNDSMEPTLKVGDTVLVNSNETNARVGLTYVVCINDKISFKRIQPMPGNRYQLISDNKTYDPIQVHIEEEDFEIIGKIEWVAHKFD